MTNKEIEKFIKKNIIGHIGNGFIQKGTYILLNSFNDILGGICFEQSASDKNSIYIWWFVQPLFIPESMISLTFGDRLEHDNRDQSWTNLDSVESIEEIRGIIQKTIPLIKSLTGPYSFYDYFNKKNKENLRIREALVYVSIWVESANWKQEIQDFIIDIDNKFDISIPWIKKVKDEIIEISISNNPHNILEDRKKHLVRLLNI